jgi:hypothetical protein
MWLWIQKFGNFSLALEDMRQEISVPKLTTGAVQMFGISTGDNLLI